MTAGPIGALCVTVAAPVMEPTTLGVNVTLNVHLPPAATVAPQGFVPEGTAEKSPLATRLEILKAPPELLVSVTVLGALVVPTVCALKLRLAGDNETGTAPVPDAAMNCGLPAPEVARATEPLTAPVLVGEKVTANVHFAEGASEPPQGVAPLPTAENVALPAIELIVTALALLLVTVTVLAALMAPMPVFANFAVVGLKVRGDVGPPVPVPERPTTCGLSAPFVVIARLPAIAPFDVGAKVAVMVHFAPAAKEEPQVPPVIA